MTKKGGIDRSEKQHKWNGSYTITKTPRYVILNAVKNPAYSLGESCLKGHKSFTTHTIAPAVGILPRPKARSE
ncbi:hypothetical protein [Gillisia limnaea]|uniref:Uncharacterized protein n=1 Tax=Gillisia limnaea (strain DSM 15749 / LMG 21470 / R-8282) TaxID=865937 RepID=H2C040_GILLR|nr:hypothetical protein [Gillisia limnaea]EHQ02407.1 hypothetical protein Gilli_1764 [Gillisia limnaea DSM 15749]